MAKLTATISVPDFRTISDDEVGEHLRMKDGRWSEQTKSLMTKLGAAKLDLNKWWAETWQGWTCPCCKRRKVEIARLGPGDVLICKLEMHHDHLGDRVSTIFRTANPNEGGPLGAQVDNAKQAVRVLCERFATSLICQDCNAAEGAAKRALSGVVPRDFTFAPAEVATFISTAPNRPHEIDEPKALAAWLAVKDDFEDRLQFANSVAGRFATGRHRRDTSTQSREAISGDDDILWAHVIGQLPRHWTSELANSVRDRSLANDSAGQTVATKKPLTRVAAPSDAEFAEVESTMPQGKKTWDGAGQNWTCECCGRSKREICRKSRRGSWSAQIHRVREWEYETEECSIAWRRPTATSPLTIGAHRYRLICQDCRNIVTKTMQRRAGLTEYSLTVEDLFLVIKASSPNQDHDADLTEAVRRAEANRDLTAAVHDYDEHCRSARGIEGQLQSLVQWDHLTRRAAMDQLILKEAKAGRPWEDATDYVDWLLEEAVRLAALE